MARKNVEGMQAVINVIHDMKVIDINALTAATKKACGEILKRSNYYVPVDTSSLKATGIVQLRALKKGGVPFEVQGRVTYGGEARSAFVLKQSKLDIEFAQKFGGPVPKQMRRVDYAIFVHEDLTKSHASPTCAKFLEKAIREKGAEFAREARNEIVAAQYAYKGRHPSLVATPSEWVESEYVL